MLHRKLTIKPNTSSGENSAPFPSLEEIAAAFQLPVGPGSCTAIGISLSM